MGKISFKDVVELAKAGYKPADVKELISLSEMADQSKQEEPQGAAPAEIEPKSVSPEPDRAPENKEPEKPEEAVDYKKLYEQSQEDLKKAQAAGSHVVLKNVNDVVKDVLDLTGFVALFDIE